MSGPTARRARATATGSQNEWAVNGGSGIGGEAALQAALLMDASRRDVILLEAFVPNAPEVKELLDRVASRELDP